MVDTLARYGEWPVFPYVDVSAAKKFINRPELFSSRPIFGPICVHPGQQQRHTTPQPPRFSPRNRSRTSARLGTRDEGGRVELSATPMGPLSVKDDGQREEDGVGLAEHNCRGCDQEKKNCRCSGEHHLQQPRGEARQTRAPDRPPPVPPPEPEWRELVANMRTLALGDQQQQKSLATARSRPKVSN